MGYTRSTIIAGPALVQFKSVNLYTKGAIELTLTTDTQSREVDLYGKTDEVAVDRKATITFTPVELTEAIIPVLFPYSTMVPGTQIYGTTDSACVIYGADGTTHTLAAAAVTSMPGLTLSASADPLGSMTISGVPDDGSDWDDSGSIVATGSLSWTDPATYARTSDPRDVYTGAWAASGVWSSFGSEDGFSIEWGLNKTDMVFDTMGTVTSLFDGLDVMVRVKPLAIGSSPIATSDLVAAMEWQTTGAARGRSIGTYASNHDLVVTGSRASGSTPKQKLTFTLKNASLKSSVIRFGRNVLRNGEVAFVATKVAGSQLYTLALS